MPPSIIHADPQSGDLARSTVARARAGLESGTAPAVSQIIHIIREISARGDHMSVADLADAISREPGTMQRIISIANTIGYNPSGVEITTATQAIAIVGMERIRNLAIAVLLMENAQSSNSSDTNRELAAASLSSGLFAAAISRHTGVLDPELAFMCGALRSYGHMLMATFMREDYDSAIARGGQAGQDQAFRAIFGLTPLDLGRELLESMQLPAMISNSLKTVPEDVRKELGAQPGSTMLAVAELGQQLAEAAASKELTHENFGSTFEALSGTYTDKLHLPATEAKRLVSEVSLQIESFCSRAGFSKKSVVLFDRLESMTLGRPLPPAYQAAPKPQPSSAEAEATTTGESNAAPSAAALASRIEAGTDEIERLLRQPGTNLVLVLKTLIRVLQDCLNLESCLVFVRDRKTDRFVLVQGIGPALKSIQPGVALKPGQQDVFAVPLLRGEDVLIEDPEDARFRRFVPEWLRPPGHALPFLLLPIKDAKGPFALVCGTSASNAAFAAVRNNVGKLQNLRSHLAGLGAFLR